MNRLQGVVFRAGRKIVATRRYKEAAKYVHGHILDIGCGSGDLAFVLQGGRTYTGIDRDSGFYKQEGCLFYQLDVELPGRARVKGPFDTIVMLAFIEHISTPESVLRWAHSLMAPGGTLIVSSPTVLGDKLVKLFTGRGKDHVRIYRMEELRRMVVRAGFELVAIRYFECFANQLVIARKR